MLNYKKIKMEIEKILNDEKLQKILNDEEFYFQKGQDALTKWLDMPLEDDLKRELLDLASDYKKFQTEASTNEEINKILCLLFEIISYCDINAKDKSKWNKYEDNRTFADASVRMNNWVDHLIRFKLDKASINSGSTLNAFNYLLDPVNNSCILSENHRFLIAKNLFKTEYIPIEFNNQLVGFFNTSNFDLKTPENLTLVLASIIYSIRTDWSEEIIGLMASDSTGWQDKYIEDFKEYDYGVVWNSKRPSGTQATIAQLRKQLKDENSFTLYFSIKGAVTYKCRVFDFAENQEEQNKIVQRNKTEKIFGYYENFSDYKTETYNAKIVFFIDSFEKIDPIPISDFAFYKNYSAPTQDNLSPIVSVSDIKLPKVGTMNTKKFIKSPINQILYGPPGTGKTYDTIRKAIEIADPEYVFPPNPNSEQGREEVKAKYTTLMNSGQIVFTTFHQSMCYEDFVEGLKPSTSNGEISYEIESGIFKTICSKASAAKTSNFSQAYKDLVEKISSSEDIHYKILTKTKTPFYVSVNQKGNLNLFTTENKNKQGAITKENLELFSIGEYPFIGWEGYVFGIITHLKEQFGLEVVSDIKKKNYVLIIDEINRGNVSQIFGELITLIEEDKRLGCSEALEVMLPYSKKNFGVPPNLYIIGTMNTADRSVEALDTALRRRFSFEFVGPDPELVPEEIDGVKLRVLFETINNRISYLLDDDHQIGHSYFMQVKTLSDVRDVFENKLIPLLKEYFYNDYGKIRLVLGDDFVSKTEFSKNPVSFALKDDDFIFEKATFKFNTILSNEDFKLAIEKTLKNA